MTWFAHTVSNGRNKILAKLRTQSIRVNLKFGLLAATYSHVCHIPMLSWRVYMKRLERKQQRRLLLFTDAYVFSKKEQNDGYSCVTGAPGGETW